jgi:hypothetical protein
MKLGLLGYTSGSIFNRTAKTGVSRLEQSTLGLTANRTSTSTRTRKSGVFRPEDNGTKQYYKGDVQSFYYVQTNTLTYSSSQPSGLDSRPNGSHIYGLSGRGDVFGSPFESVNQLFLPTSGSTKSSTLTDFNLFWRTSGNFRVYYPELQGMKFKSDGTKLFGVGTLTDSGTGSGKRYYGTVFYIWSPQTSYSLSSFFTVTGTPATDIGKFPEYYLVNINGNSPSDTPIDDPDISDGNVGSGGLRVKDTFMHPDGLIFYYLSNDVLYQGSLTTAWYLGPGSAPGEQVTLNTASLSVTPNDYSVNAFTFNSTGTKLFTFATTNSRIQQYNLGTAWQISTASLSNSLDIAVTGGSRIGIRMLDSESTIMALSRTITTSGTSSSGFLHEVNQALY